MRVLCCLMLIISSCETDFPESRPQEAVVTEPDPIEQPLHGRIGQSDWEFARALAYKNPNKPDEVIVELYPDGGPTGCSVQGRKIQRIYGKGAAKEVDTLTLHLPATITNLPWFTNTAKVDIADAQADGTEATGPAATALVEITEFNEHRIVGTMKASALAAYVVGKFSVTYCR